MNPYEILQNNQNYAIVGMHPDKDKYANKIYRLLKEKGKSVYGLNPKYKEAEGEKLYKDLDDLNKDIDVVVFLVNPKIGLHMLEGMKKHQIKHLWMQPGSLDEDFETKAKELELDLVDACVLAVYSIYEGN